MTGHTTFDLSTAEPEAILDFACEAVREPEPAKLATLDDFATPIYATDAEGRLTYYNRACVAFSGRQPVVGVDKWCVTWKLFTTEGAELPHDRCPMAVAIKEARKVRGEQAIAERPDGSQVHFTPFPTLIHDEAGRLVGAVNMLIDMAQSSQARHLRTQAERCRRLARNIDDRLTKDRLTQMAQTYEEQAKGVICV